MNEPAEGGIGGRRCAVWAWVVAGVLAMVGMPARAHVNSGANCASCHGSSRSGMTVTGFQTTTNLGAGVLKVFQVKAGETASIGINVTDGHNEYGLALVNLGGSGVTSAGNKLAYTADASWAKRTSYYSVGPSSSNKAWTFRLAVQAGTPSDFYLLQMRLAGQSSNRWSQEERFYVQVVAPVPQAPRVTEPTWMGGVFACRVTTESGFTYRLEANRGGAGGAWVVAGQVVGDGTVKVLSDAVATGGAAVYRVRVE